MREPALRGRVEACVPCLLIPRRLLDVVGAWDEPLPVCGDQDFVLRLGEHARLRGDGESVYRYRRHGGSTSSAPPPGLPDPWRAVYDRHYRRHPEHVGAREERWLEAAYTMGSVAR